MELSNNVIEILEYLGKKFGVAVDFSNQNIMPYLQQLADKYIDYRINTSIFWIVLCTLAAVIGIILIAVEIKVFQGEAFICGICGGFILCLGVIFICINIYQIILCKTFPEKAIFDYLINLKQSI